MISNKTREKHKTKKETQKKEEEREPDQSITLAKELRMPPSNLKRLYAHSSSQVARFSDSRDRVCYFESGLRRTEKKSVIISCLYLAVYLYVGKLFSASL